MNVELMNLRQCERHKIELRAVLTFRRGNVEVMHGYTKDITRYGICFVSPEEDRMPPPAGSYVEVHLALPRSNNVRAPRAMRCQGTVVWSSTESKDRCWHVGIEVFRMNFTEMPRTLSESRLRKPVVAATAGRTQVM